MDHAEPKTRKEAKGGKKGKNGGKNIYSQKHVRQQEALASRAGGKKPVTPAKN